MDRAHQRASAADTVTAWTLDVGLTSSAVQVLYFLYRIVWHYASVTIWTLAGYAFLLGSTYLSYSWVVGAAEEGGSSECVCLVLAS